jgi:hypothetical protein
MALSPNNRKGKPTYACPNGAIFDIPLNLFVSKGVLRGKFRISR